MAFKVMTGPSDLDHQEANAERDEIRGLSSRAFLGPSSGIHSCVSLTGLFYTVETNIGRECLALKSKHVTHMGVHLAFFSLTNIS